MRKLLSLLLLLSFHFSYAQNVKWEESFEDEDIFSRGWTLRNLDSSGSATMHILPAFEFVTIGNQAPHSGSYFWRFNFEDANYKKEINDWLISPRLENIQAGDSISFWCGAVDRNYKDTLKIFISTTSNDPSSFTMIDNFKVEGPVGMWHKKSYDLSAYAGGNIYFAVNYNLSDAGALGVSSDHVWIDFFTLTGKDAASVVTSYQLYQNFPNPFNPSTQIRFDILEPGNVSLKIYDTAGKLIAALVNGFMQKGKFSIDFSANGIASGVYFYKLVAGSFTDTKKMSVIK